MQTTDYQKQGTDFLKENGIKMTVKFVDYKPYFEPKEQSRDVFRITFSRQGNRFSLTFGQSIIKSTGNGGSPPTAYDVLSCIEKREPEDFDYWCGEFGFDTDSRRAERIYKEVVKQWGQVSKFFTESEIEQLQEIY